MELGRRLDLGEAEAIALTEQLGARFLLIDEAAGRRIARQRGVPVTGVAGVLLAAKARGELVAVRPIIEEISNAGYRLSSRLVSACSNVPGSEPTIGETRLLAAVITL